MRKAIQMAREYKLKIALIDQNIELTIKKLIKSITFKEKLRFIKDLFIGTPIKKQELKEFDLKKVPKETTIIKMINQVKGRYPNVYKVLVKERNELMAKNLNKLILLYPKKSIFAIVGAGHEKGIIGELKLIKN
jgi:pheromone shutdown protein TraB